MADFGVFDEENDQTKPNEKKTDGEGFEETSENRYLIFNLGTEYYATPLMGVREIIEPQNYKPLPNTLPFFLGVTNLRGQIVGLIDLRKRFDVPADTQENMALIVFDTPSGPLAALVDKVVSVNTINEEDIERKPNIKTRIPSNYLLGIAKSNDQLFALIDLQSILSADELLSVTGLQNTVV